MWWFLTDDLDMEALADTIPERAERAVSAGCDLALYCWADMAVMEEIARRLPTMTERTSVRLERALEQGASVEADKEDLLAQRDQLLALVSAAA